MADRVADLLARWRAADVLDDETADRIRAYEREHAGASRLRWPVWLALAFGGLLLAAGVLLFVSAHWVSLSPGARFTLVVILVAVFHVCGASVAKRFPAMATSLHAVGTVALGGGVFLAGQIFNLDEHWPGGMMLWALGAVLAWAILRQSPQMALAALLVPAWLGCKWVAAADAPWAMDGSSVLASGSFLLALAYMTADDREPGAADRRVLRRVGAVALVPAALVLAALAVKSAAGPGSERTLVAGLRAVGWSAALGLPMLVGVTLRGRGAWPLGIAVIWVVVLMSLREGPSQTTRELMQHAWLGAGAAALAAWGAYEARPERINLGAALFALAVLYFYFSEVTDKLERSVSLVGLGLLFLAGGWALERIRRGLVLQARSRHA